MQGILFNVFSKSLQLPRGCLSDLSCSEGWVLAQAGVLATLRCQPSKLLETRLPRCVREGHTGTLGTCLLLGQGSVPGCWPEEKCFPLSVSKPLGRGVHTSRLCSNSGLEAWRVGCAQVTQNQAEYFPLATAPEQESKPLATMETDHLPIAKQPESSLAGPESPRAGPGCTEWLNPLPLAPSGHSCPGDEAAGTCPGSHSW